MHNDKGEIFLVKWENEWEVPGRRYKGNFTVNQFVENMGKYHKNSLEHITLGGLFTFHYTYRDKPTLMHYYKATVKTPSEIKTDAAGWFTLEEALRVIPYSEMRHILEKLFDPSSMGKVWGGAFTIYKGESGQRTSQILERLAPLN